MKKITKGILAAALVLLFAGVFAGAAAAAEVSVAAPGGILIVEDHVEIVSSVPGAEYHVTAAATGVSAEQFNPDRAIIPSGRLRESQLVKLEERLKRFNPDSTSPSLNPEVVRDIINRTDAYKPPLIGRENSGNPVNIVRNGFDARGAAVSVNREPAAGERFEVNSVTIVVDGKVFEVEKDKELYAGKEKTARGEGRMDGFTKRYGGR